MSSSNQWFRARMPANSADRTGWALREVGSDVQFLVGAANAAPSYYYYTVTGVRHSWGLAAYCRSL